MATRRKSASAFEKYAHEYDWMTNAAQREVNHAREVDAIIERCYPTRVLDAGCATGLTTALFARRGIPSVGLDHSRPMIAVARQKYADSVLPMTFRWGKFERLPKAMDSSFDTVVCLANAITGVSAQEGLMASLRGFYRVLSDRGTLVLQMLNYLAVEEGTLLPIRATENHGIVYARYSQRRGKRLAIHVVRIDLNAKPPVTEPFVHEFDNYSPDEMLTAIRRSGFKNIEAYGELTFQKHFTKTSRDLVILARR